MRCPTCGAVHSSEQCPDSATAFATPSPTSELSLQSDEIDQGYLVSDALLESSTDSVAPQQTSRLIAFPGVSHVAVPPWRKELSKRVREVQEKRVREAALANEEGPKHKDEPASSTPPQLELLPHTELPEVNPIVAAALRRIERAHQSATTQPLPASYQRATAAVATARNASEYQPKREYQVNREAQQEASPITVEDRPGGSHHANTTASVPRVTAAVAPVLEREPEILPIAEPTPTPFPERTHNLVVVQPPVVADTATQKPMPRRVIADNDPVLQYLDNVATADIPMPEVTRSPVFSRLGAGFVDLLAAAFFSLPFAALIEFLNGNWHNPRIAGTMGGIVAVVLFIYLTVSTALTGRTFGMRLFSLRAIDVKTGLIPTGKQSAGSALLFILSFATLGLAFCFALVNAERRAAHDRLSRTAVVRI